MKNMKLSVKLISSFLIMVTLAAIVGAVGMFGMSRISAADTELYEKNLIAVQTLGKIQYNITALGVHNRNIVIYPAASNTFQSSDKAITDIMNAMRPCLTHIRQLFPIREIRTPSINSSFCTTTF